MEPEGPERQASKCWAKNMIQWQLYAFRVLRSQHDDPGNQTIGIAV